MSKASRGKQPPYLGVDGDGRPLIAAPSSSPLSVAGVPIAWVIAVIASSFWVSAHFLGPLAPVAGVGYVITSVVLGLLDPRIGSLFTISLVPFYAGEMPQGLGELARSAPIIGSAIRLLLDRFRGPTPSSSWQPNLPIVLAALVAIILYPLTRVTANGAIWASPERIVDDTLFLVGAPVAMYCSWIVFSHLPHSAVNKAIQVLPFIFLASLVVAIGSWAGLAVFDPFAFKGVVYGRLASLGFPTPTAMGVAVTLPLAAGYLWSRSRNFSIGLILLGILVIVLTQSRGPLIALMVAAALLVVSNRKISLRVWIAGISLALLSACALLLIRYPDLLQKISHGRLPKFYGDELRVLSWVAGVEVALQHPITGGGWMSVSGWHDGELLKSKVNLSHNIVLQGLSDGGFFLGGAILTVLIGSLRTAWQRRHSIPSYWLSAAVVLLVCGLWDMPQLRAYAAVMGGAVLGFVSRKSEERNDAVA